MALTPEQLQKYWDANPEALEQAIQENPMGFLTGGLQQNYNNFTGYEQSLTNIAPPEENFNRWANDLRLSQDLAHVPGSGSGGEAATGRQTTAKNAAFDIAEGLGQPLVNDQGMGLNTGFVYTRDGMLFQPGEGAVGEYNIVPKRTGSSAANFMTDIGIPMLLSTMAGPLATSIGTVPAAAVTGGIQGAARGGDLQDIVKSGLMSGLMAGVSDYIGDAVQTGGSEEYYQGLFDRGILNEEQLADALRLRNTSDVGNLFGPNGLLGGEYIGTETLNQGLNTLINNPVTDFLASNPVSQTLFEIADPAIISAVNQTLGYDFQDPANEALLEGDIRGGFRYDERFTGADNPRGDVDMPGIFEENPYNDPMDGAPFGYVPRGEERSPIEEKEVLPEREEPSPILTDLEQTGDQALEELTGETTAELDELGDFSEGDLDLTGEGEDNLPSPGEGLDFGPYPSDGTLPPSNSTGSIENELPATGSGGGGTGGGEGVQQAAKAAGMGQSEWKDFMAGIDYHAPMIQQLQIPMQDYMAMWMRNK